MTARPSTASPSPADDAAFDALRADLASGMAIDLDAESNWTHVKRLAREHAAMKDRLFEMAEVPCPNDIPSRKMTLRCMPEDPCTYCRVRALLAVLRMTFTARRVRFVP